MKENSVYYNGFLIPYISVANGNTWHKSVKTDENGI